MSEPKASKPPKAKAPPSVQALETKPGRTKPKAGAPAVCSSCGKKWARFDKDGLCAKCAKEASDVEELPPLRPQDMPGDDSAPLTPQQVKRGRIFEIAQLMASGEWRASMAKTLAKAWSSPEWTMSIKTVQHYSAEASRLLDYTTGQREKLVNIARLRLVEVLHENESDRVAAARTLLEHLGELRQNVTVKAALDPFDGWTDAEILHFGETKEKPERLGPRKPPRK